MKNIKELALRFNDPKFPEASVVSIESRTTDKPTNLRNIKLEGWLQKRGEKGAIKRWTMRWFVVKGGVKLFYYAKNGENSKGFIDLLQTTEVTSHSVDNKKVLSKK